MTDFAVNTCSSNCCYSSLKTCARQLFLVHCFSPHLDSFSVITEIPYTRTIAKEQRFQLPGGCNLVEHLLLGSFGWATPSQYSTLNFRSHCTKVKNNNYYPLQMYTIMTLFFYTSPHDLHYGTHNRWHWAAFRTFMRRTQRPKPCNDEQRLYWCSPNTNSSL